MKKLKLMIIVVLILIITCISIILMLKGKYKEFLNQDIVTTQEPELLENNIEEITENSENYSNIKGAIIKYLYYLEENNEDAINSICQNHKYNITKVIKSMDIEKAYILDNIINEVFFLKININNNIYNYALTIDGNTIAYKLTEIDEEDFNKVIKGDISQEYKQYEKIENKNYNSIEFNENLEIRFNFLNLKNAITTDSASAYSLLDKDYKDKRFKNDINNFNNYVDEIKNKMIYATLIKNNVRELEDKKIYIVEDNYSNQYVFIDEGNFIYTVMLDRYTIVDEVSKSRYINLDNESKAHTNIDMFIKMINTKDYQHAYEKLDNTFKANNFGTIENFIEYVKNNFYDNNILTVDGVEQKNDVYILNVTLSSNTSSIAEEMKKSFVVKLGEDTDFSMSFNVN